MNVQNHLKEMLEGSQWRILSKDALQSDKFVASMELICMDDQMFPGSTVAHGYITGDSRGLFADGERVRTSAVKQIVEVDGQLYIETRNTMYKILNPEQAQNLNV